jgi:hypothetical protein
MPRNRSRDIKALTPAKDATIKQWQFFRNILEFERIIKEKDIGVSDISEGIGIKEYTVRNYVYAPQSSRKSIPPHDVMKLLHDSYGYDIYYVITGERETPKEKDLGRVVDSYKSEIKKLQNDCIKKIDQLQKLVNEKEGVIKFLKGETS